MSPVRPLKLSRSTIQLRDRCLQKSQLLNLQSSSSMAVKETVVSVGRNNTIFSRDGGLHAGTDGLLPIVEVTETSYQLRFVKGIHRDIHLPHREHVRVEFHEFYGCGFHDTRRGLALVGLCKRKNQRYWAVVRSLRCIEIQIRSMLGKSSVF